MLFLGVPSSVAPCSGFPGFIVCPKIKTKTFKSHMIRKMPTKSFIQVSEATISETKWQQIDLVRNIFFI